MKLNLVLVLTAMMCHKTYKDLVPGIEQERECSEKTTPAGTHHLFPNGSTNFKRNTILNHAIPATVNCQSIKFNSLVTA